jgi:hypothetical protein
LKEPVAGLLTIAPDVEERQVLVPAVDGLVEQRAVSFGQVDGLEDGDAIEYSTMPRALRGASCKSWITALN